MVKAWVKGQGIDSGFKDNYITSDKTSFGPLAIIKCTSAVF